MHHDNSHRVAARRVGVREGRLPRARGAAPVGTPAVSEELNPALGAARYCPRCRAEVTIDYPRSLSCPACGYGAYYNPKPVAATIPVDGDGRIVLLRRGFDPGGGLWTFPGGFVDLGESVEDAARREADEELGIGVELGRIVGVYSRPDDRVILIVYAATTADVPRTTAEAVEVRAFAYDELPWDELAFWSTERALRDFGRAG